MKYEAKVTSVTELMDAGLPPAQAAAIHVVARLALETIVQNCSCLSDRGASAEEVEAYRERAEKDIAAWVMKSVPPVAEGIQRLLEERMAIRDDVEAMLG